LRDNRVFITPIYQQILGKALGYVITTFNEDDPTRTWNSLKTLFYTCPLEVKKECRQLLDDINHEVQTLNAPRSLRNAGTQVETENRLNKFLFQKTHELFEKIVASLIERGYLETKWSRVKREDFEGLEEQE